MEGVNKFKVKKCRDCKVEFQPFKFAQPRCFDCAVKKGKADAQRKKLKIIKEERAAFKRETARRKKALRTRSDEKKIAQDLFNKYIRLRDNGCITCDRAPGNSDLITGSRWDAGHYLSRGAFPELAFDEDNCHKQCSYCNSHLSGNVAVYRINLIKKIGIERVEKLEGPHEQTKFTIEQYRDMQQTYKLKIKQLEKNADDSTF